MNVNEDFDKTFSTWKLLNILSVSKTVDDIAEELDTKDNEKVDLVKRLVLSFLPPIHKDERIYGGFNILLKHVDWLSGEEELDDARFKIKTIRIRHQYESPPRLEQGDSIWVTHNQDVPKTFYRPGYGLDGTDPNFGIARVVIESPTDDYAEYLEPNEELFRVKVDLEKIIPMERLCLYFEAAEQFCKFPDDIEDWMESIGWTSMEGTEHPCAVFTFCTWKSDRVGFIDERLYKQVDGNWYWLMPPDEVNWESESLLSPEVNDDIKSEKFQLMLLTQNQLMRYRCPDCNEHICFNWGSFLGN